MFRQLNDSSGNTYSRMLFSQVSANNMMIEVGNQSNDKGNLLLHPYGGNVVIGTTSAPSGKLHVAGTSYLNGVVSQATGVWHTSLEGVGRYFYSSGGRTYYKSGDGSHEFRNSSDTGVFFIETNGNVGIGTSSAATYKLQVNGSFAATTKSFVIDHPSKPGMKLRYGSLEGPENGVYIRGRLTNEHHIQFPDYWKDLVDIDTVTVQLTAIGVSIQPTVGYITEACVNVLGNNIDCFYFIQAERKDVEKLEVETYE